MPRIFDNIEEHLNSALRQSFAASYRLDACTGYFNLRGWSQLADIVDAIPQRGDEPKVRLLIGMAERPDRDLQLALRRGPELKMDNQTAARLKGNTLTDLRKQLTYGVPVPDDESALRSLKRQLASGEVAVRLHLRHRLHAKLYLCCREDTDNPMTGYVGSSNLTFAGLLSQGELNVDVLDHDATRKLQRWFEERWEDQFSIDVADALVEIVDASWASEKPLSPYLVYLKMAYHLSRDAREGLLEYGLPKELKSVLLDFQAAAVQVAARILDRRGGVMIGDVVGLGKTIAGTAIARLWQEERGTETLIVCPKNLVDMWEGYVYKHRLHAKVLSLSMAVKELEDMRRYRVVIVDESHNLRRSNRQDYAALKDYISRNESKVVLLTATPYNVDFSDAANQLALFVDEDTNLGITPDHAMRRMDAGEFLRRCDDKPQTLKAFRLSEEREDWQRLMSLFLVRRTRRFITDNYALTDEAGRKYLNFTGGDRFYFPERTAKPIPHLLKRDDPAAAMVSERTLDAIAKLHLPRYSAAQYLQEQPGPSTEEEARIIADLKRALRGNLRGVTLIMLYKRLSSSPASFILSLERHLLRNWIWLTALSEGKNLPIGSMSNAQLEDEDEGWVLEGSRRQEDLEGGVRWGRGSRERAGQAGRSSRTPESWKRAARRAYDDLRASGSRQMRWIDCRLFRDELRDDLQDDIKTLQRLLERFGDWRQEDDSKLDALERLLTEEHHDDKVLVFTEYRDTAEYVAGALAERGTESVAWVSGATDDPTALAKRFSPKTNTELGTLKDGETELRVLVATDVLSEGQNLQDAHVVVNFDLPWAIVKIIQRAGRVDRIGQKSPEVLVYSFLPADDVEEVIRLRGRIRRRLEENAAVFGSDESFFGERGELKVIQGLYDERAHPDDADGGAEDVDAVSLAYEIWRKATEGNPQLKEKVESLPDVVYSTRSSEGVYPEGVLTYARSKLGLDALAFTPAGDNGGTPTLLSPAEALERARCEPDAEALSPLEEHHELVRLAVTGPLRTPSPYLEGALSGIRKRCWDKLNGNWDRFAGTLLEANLKDALDDLYRKPLKEQASQTLARALRERPLDDLAEVLIELRQDGRLCVAERDLDEDDIQIICSMGIRN